MVRTWVGAACAVLFAAAARGGGSGVVDGAGSGVAAPRTSPVGWRGTPAATTPAAGPSMTASPLRPGGTDRAATVTRRARGRRADRAGSASRDVLPPDSLEERRTPLLRAMAELDRLYVPALWLTSAPDRPGARRAVARLDSAWRAFRGARGGDPLLEDRGELDAAGWCIEAAANMAAEGVPLQGVHDVLEPVAGYMAELRARSGLRYFPDLLVDYHGPMEEIARAGVALREGSAGRPAEPGAAPKAAERPMEVIRAELPAARAAWRRVARARPDPAVHGLDDTGMAAVDSLVSAGTEVLDRLAGTLEGGDRASVARAAVGLRAPFARLYLLLGGVWTGG